MVFHDHTRRANYSIACQIACILHADTHSQNKNTHKADKVYEMGRQIKSTKDKHASFIATKIGLMKISPRCR